VLNHSYFKTAAFVQAIEFWSVLAEIELLLKEDEEINGVTSSTESECKRFLERCSEELVPKLLELLLLQNEEQDDEDTEWCVPLHMHCDTWLQ
jgi:importin subunit beta-1